MKRIKEIIAKWLAKWHKNEELPGLPEPVKPSFIKGEMNINDSILLCYLVEYNRKNELLDKPKYMLLEVMAGLTRLYYHDIEIEKLIELDIKIKSIIGKMINQKAVEYNEFVDCESIYLDYLGGDNADVPEV